MNKVKYLYRKSRCSRKKDVGSLKKFKRTNTKNLFLELPKHEKMRPVYQYSNYCNYDSKPLQEFIKSKIGEDWNDVYSEIIKKTPYKFRMFLDDDLGWIIKRPMYYDDDYIPKLVSYGGNGIICYDRLYVDLDNIIRCDSKEVLFKKSKKIIRKIKIEQITENESQSSD